MFWPAFLSLACAGLLGIAVFVATAPKTLLEVIPIDGDVRKRLLIAVQPTILLIVLAAVGSAVTGSTGSNSLIADAARGASLPANWLVPISLFFVVGIVLGAFLYLVDRLWRPWWGRAGDTDLITDWRPANLIGGVAYGGITEEVMMRWGFMGVALWALAAIFGEQGEPGAVIVAAAILIAALLFAAAHLPAALAGGKPRSGRFVVRIMVLNTAAGILFGLLFWRWNLETGMAAHAGFHVGAAILVVALRRGGEAQQA